MKEIFIKARYIILMIIVCQLLNTYCARHIHPGYAPLPLETRIENKNTEELATPHIEKPISSANTVVKSKGLQDFMKDGVEKEINTGYVSADEIIHTAQKYLGVPHCMGGKTMKCIDCSGLLMVVFARYGIHLPHNSEEQARFGKMITEMDKLTKGDLVFFTRSYKTHYFITHSGIYIGNNKFIHTSSKNGVTMTSLNDAYWNEKFVFGTRVLK
jgi:murein DD-endopeptidase / murein LD-carboxypeptidase